MAPGVARKKNGLRSPRLMPAAADSVSNADGAGAESEESLMLLKRAVGRAVSGLTS